MPRCECAAARAKDPHVMRSAAGGHWHIAGALLTLPVFSSPRSEVAVVAQIDAALGEEETGQPREAGGMPQTGQIDTMRFHRTPARGR